MLPAVKTNVKRMTLAALASLSIAALPAAPALAWGPNEQNFLKGVVATIAVQALIREAKKHPRQPVYQQPAYQPVYADPVYQPAPVHNSIYRTPASRAFQSYSAQERKLIQRRLSAFGYYRGGIDGSFGPGTYSAIVAYADDEGMRDRLASNAGAFGVLDSLIY